MKKFSIGAAAVLAAVTLSSSASALDTTCIRAIRSSNFPLQSLLGVVSFTAMGIDGGFCLYLMDWMSPYNPNDVTVCVLAEARAPVFPSCVINAFVDITSFVSAGPGSVCPTFCAGFDTLGIAYPDITILAGEFLIPPVLQGTAIFPTAVPLIHAIEVA